MAPLEFIIESHYVTQWTQETRYLYIWQGTLDTHYITTQTVPIEVSLA